MKLGNFLLGFAVLISFFVVMLTLKGQFGLLHAMIFVFLMLASLLGYGRIGEKTFKEMSLLILKRSKE